MRGMPLEDVTSFSATTLLNVNEKEFTLTSWVYVFAFLFNLLGRILVPVFILFEDVNGIVRVDNRSERRGDDNSLDFVLLRSGSQKVLCTSHSGINQVLVRVVDIEMERRSCEESQDSCELLPLEDSIFSRRRKKKKAYRCAKLRLLPLQPRRMHLLSRRLRR